MAGCILPNALTKPIITSVPAEGVLRNLELTLNQLGLFAKFWQPGAVKTRLAASIGESAACALYKRFVFHLLQRLGNSADQRAIVFSPPESESKFRMQIPPNWKLCPQSPGDLGSRMHSYFLQAFKTATQVVIIGADCPHLPASTIDTAFKLLSQAPVVLGPSTDGGYYLIGMRARCFDIFDSIQWSTESVLEKTIQHLEKQNIDYRLLETMTDVDELVNLKTVEAALAAQHQTQRPSDEDSKLLGDIRQAIAIGESNGPQ